MSEEILKEMKEICDVWVKMDGKVKSYTQDEIHLIYDYISNLQQENSQLKERIEKAIEYIEKNMYFYDGMQNEDRNIGLFENNINDLLKILKGEYKNVKN